MKRTTTKIINEAISNNLLQVIKVECYNKDHNTTDLIDGATFIENLQFLNESGVLADCVSWHFEKNYKKDREYIIESGRKDGDSENVITVYMKVGDDVNIEDVEKILLEKKEE